MSTILFIFLIVLCLAIGIKIKNITCGEKIEIILIFLSIASTLSFNTGRTFVDYNGDNILRIPLSVIVIVAIGITKCNFRKRCDIVEISLIILIINVLLWYFNVTTMVKYFNFIYLYISILFLYEIMKSLKNIKMDFFLNILSIFTIANGILGIFQYILNMRLLPGMWSSSIYFLEETGGMVKRAVGFAGTNNAAGNLGAILFCMVLFSCLFRKKKMDYIALVLASIFVILTLTRLGYLAIMVQIIIYYCFINAKTLKGIAYKYNLTLLVVIIVSLILIKYQQDIYQTLFVNRGFTSDYRISQFDFIINNVIKGNLLMGVGPGEVTTYIYNNFARIELDVHSQFLNVIAEQGIVMFIIYFMLNIIILVRNLIKYKDRLTKCFIVAFFLTYIIVSNYNPNQYYFINNLLYYSIMFIFLKLDKKQINTKIL